MSAVEASGVSVVIPAFNAGCYIGAAIESILAQTLPALEILVVDDGSHDDTATIVARFGPPVSCIRQVNAGVAAARNRGIEASRGRYVAFLDADDTWLPHKLERQLAELTNKPDRRACYSAMMVVDEELRPQGARRSSRHASALEDLILRGNVIGSICSVVCERSLFDIAGGFDPRLSQCADWEMWIRLAVFTEFEYIDEPLVTYRQHGANMSRNAALLERDGLYLLDKAFRMPSLPESVIRQRNRAYGRMYTVLAGSYFNAGELVAFLRCVARALLLDPLQIAHIGAFPARRLRRLCAPRLNQGPVV